MGASPARPPRGELAKKSASNFTRLLGFDDGERNGALEWRRGRRCRGETPLQEQGTVHVRLGGQTAPTTVFGQGRGGDPRRAARRRARLSADPTCRGSVPA